MIFYDGRTDGYDMRAYWAALVREGWIDILGRTHKGDGHNQGILIYTPCQMSRPKKIKKHISKLRIYPFLYLLLSV